MSEPVRLSAGSSGAGRSGKIEKLFYNIVKKRVFYGKRVNVTKVCSKREEKPRLRSEMKKK